MAQNFAVSYFFTPFATAACRNQDICRIMNLYGYARVSTNGQALDAQVAQLEAAGCGRIWQEKVSGAKTDRAELKKLLRALRNGDLVLVTRLDRLARSTRDLLNILASVSDRRAGFRSLGDIWADTTTAHGRLMLTVLGGLAEFERELIRTRTAEGRARAVAMGVRLGRRPKLDQEQRREACARKVAGEGVASIAKAFKVSDSTISRLQCG
jgi:DNA invertase Pin-like site-specific DNA recombinase